MESSERRSRYDRSRSFSATREASRARPKALSFSRSPSIRGRRPQRTRSLGHRSLSSSSFSSSSRSRSRSRSRRPRRSSRSRRSTKNRDDRGSRPEEKRGAMAALKSAAPLLATIGVASVVAHKFWPKGVLFGDKEEWETRKVVERRARTVVKDEDGRLHRARSVREREGGDLVIEEVVRKNGRGRREHSLDDRARNGWGEGRARGPQRPYPPHRSRLPPPEDADLARQGNDRTYLPAQRRHFEDPRYDDGLWYEDRAYRPRRHVDDRAYEEQGRR